MLTRALLLAAVFLLLAGGHACAEEQEEAGLDEVIEQVLAANTRGDTKTLARLARLANPDPWIVAEMLCADGEDAAAKAFAKAAPSSSATEKLAAYVSRRRQPADRFYKRYDQVLDALEAEDDKALLRLTADLPKRMPTVLHVRLGDWRAGAQERLGDWLAAGKDYAAAAEGARALGWTRRAADLSLAAGDVLHAHGAYPVALHQAWLALRGYRGLDANRGAAEAHELLRVIHVEMGALEWARESGLKALALWQAVGDKGRVALIRLWLGEVCQYLGDYPAALEQLEILRTSPNDLEDPADRVELLNLLGFWHERMGNMSRALTFMEAALAQATELGATRVEILSCIDLGSIHALRGDHRKAIELNERALALSEKSDFADGAASALTNIGMAYEELGELDKALAYYERSLKPYADIEDFSGRVGEARTRESLGLLLAAMGQKERALTYAKQAVAMARAADSRTMLLSALRSLAETQHRAGQYGEALATAREARTFLRRMLTGLGEGETTSLRASYHEVFRVGALAAAREGDFAEAVAFIEEGRAMTLATALGNSARPRLSPLLQLAEAKAHSEVAQARAEIEKKHKQPDADTTAEERALDEALDALRQVRDRIRAAGGAGDVVAPKPITLAALQRMLRPSQAFVYYLVDDREVVAVVVEEERVRTSILGTRAALDEGIDNLHGPDGMRTRGRRERVKTERSGTNAFAALRSLLIEPLNLGKQVRELVVSPAGPVGYVPFGGLVDLPVALVPSATAWLILRRDRASRGTGVLALGNPDYAGASKTTLPVQVRGETLAVLPATEVEAKTVGDPVLLGAQANEAELRKRLQAKKRWRALHFACHGLLDPERPRLSALALSRLSKDDDGLLSAVEIFGLPLSADLAVLSACETGRGRVQRGEGIRGLTRSCLYAGAPRVICSLWKVDDEATRALMVKFYELWNPKTGTGLGAAQALAEAQAHVRAQARWERPYYWAAWVLWGLPE